MPSIKKIKRRASGRSAEMVFDLRVGKDGPEPILAAAYLSMDRAYAVVSGDKRKVLRVTLRPKTECGAAESAAIRAAFVGELAAQRLRWAIARNNKSVREYVAENALALAKEFSQRDCASPAPAVEELTPEQRSEIDRLIAEVETEIAQMNVRKGPSRADEASLSWEAAQKREPGGGT